MRPPESQVVGAAAATERGVGSRARRLVHATGRHLRESEPVPRPLIALLVAAALLVGAWSIAVAPLMGPDEIYHTGYVQYLAETGQPPLGGNVAGQPYSTQQAVAMAWGSLVPLIGVPEGRPAWSGLEQHRWVAADRALPPRLRKDGTGPTGVGAYPPLYYGYEALAFKASASTGFFGQLLAMRLANAALYLATIALGWALAGEVLGARGPRALATAILALLPQLAFLGGSVNPDTLLVAMSTAVLLASVRLVRRGPTLARVAALGVLAAATVLTHTRGVAVVPSALAALVIALWVHRPGWGQALRQTAVLVGALALGGVIYLASTKSVTVSTPGAAKAAAFSVPQFVSYVWQFYLPKLPFMAPKLGPTTDFVRPRSRRSSGSLPRWRCAIPSGRTPRCTRGGSSSRPGLRRWPWCATGG